MRKWCSKWCSKTSQNGAVKLQTKNAESIENIAFLK